MILSKLVYVGAIVSEVCDSSFGVPERFIVIGEQIQQQKFETCGIFIKLSVIG